MAVVTDVTENVEEGVGEQISVSVASVALQYVDIVARHIRVFDVVRTDLTSSTTSPLCVKFSHYRFVKKYVLNSSVGSTWLRDLCCS